jgi:hypothetical protein
LLDRHRSSLVAVAALLTAALTEALMEARLVLVLPECCLQPIRARPVVGLSARLRI